MICLKHPCFRVALSATASTWYSTRRTRAAFYHPVRLSSLLRIQVNETGLPTDEARDIVKKWVRSKDLLSNNTGPLLNENNWDL